MELYRCGASDRYGEHCSAAECAVPVRHGGFFCGQDEPEVRFFTVRRRPSMKAETTYMKTLGKVEAKLSRMKEQAAAVRWFYESKPSGKL